MAIYQAVGAFQFVHGHCAGRSACGSAFRFSGAPAPLRSLPQSERLRLADYWFDIDKIRAPRCKEHETLGG